jgi:hypothetical protein
VGWFSASSDDIATFIYSRWTLSGADEWKIQKIDPGSWCPFKRDEIHPPWPRFVWNSRPWWKVNLYQPKFKIFNILVGFLNLFGSPLHKKHIWALSNPKNG